MSQLLLYNTIHICTVQFNSYSTNKYSNITQDKRFSMVDITDESFDKITRRMHGIHYTNEENILKVIKPLFLDQLYKEFDNIKSNELVLYQRFHDKLASLTFFDPACGSGNFLSITYREIRILEHLVLYKIKQIDTNYTVQPKVNIDQLYGIELNSNSVNITKTNLSNIHDSMNQELSNMFDISNSQLPTKKQPNIMCADALEIDWNDILPSKDCNYIMGNPPFGGTNTISKEQRFQLVHLTNKYKVKTSNLDYVTGWFIKAGEYIKDHTRIGLVSTNSICQGEQVYPLWTILLDRLNLNIQFAYKSFLWNSETNNKARVTVIIIGLSKQNTAVKYLYSNDVIKETPYITPYLNSSQKKRPIVQSSKILNKLPPMRLGVRTTDDGNYIFTEQEKDEFIKKEPNAEKYLKQYLSAADFINNKPRYVLYLKDCPPNELKKMPHVLERVKNVKQFRSSCKSKQSQDMANTPILFGNETVLNQPYLLVPRVSSERREYIPIGFVDQNTIPSDAVLIVPNADLSLFAILNSKIHNVWVPIVCGRLKNDYRYSNGICYNTFPVPKSDLKSLKPLAQEILDIRDKYKDSSLADLYDPDTMPIDLLKAHKALDKKVESLYRKEPFIDDDDRLEFLLSEYSKMIGEQEKLS